MNKNLIYIFVVAVLLLVIMLISFNKEKVSSMNITGKEAEALISSGAVVIDVRTKAEYDGRHIKEAINIPYDEIDSIDLDKEETIILYCQSGKRAKTALETLIQKGYKKIYNLGSIDDYTGEFV